MSGITIKDIHNELYFDNELYLSLDETQKLRFKNYFNTFFESFFKQNEEQDLNKLIEVIFDLVVNHDIYIISEREYIEEQMKERASCLMLKIEKQFEAPKIEDFIDFECLKKKNKFYTENNMFSPKDKKKKHFKKI